MAAAPLLVQLSPAPAAEEKAILKLQAYFQSARRSGGGECTVRFGPRLGTFWVQFSEERDRKSVESRPKHTLELGAECVEIFILTGEGDLGKNQVTAQASASSSNVSATYSNISATYNDISASSSNVSATYSDISASSSNVSATYNDISASSSNVSASSSDISATCNDISASYSDVSASYSDLSPRYSDVSASYSDLSASPALPQQEQQDSSGRGATAKEDLTKKIFLTVSATLNTSMFTEDQREKITIMCPNLKRERNPGMDGFEKLTGDFTDIEKAYHYFEDILSGKDPNHDFSHSECKNGLKDESGLNTEEINEFTVVTPLYEYFNHTRKEEIKELWEKFGACLRIKGYDEENTLIYLSSDKSPEKLKAASDFFIKTFQETTKDLTQKEVPITNSHTLEEKIRKLNERFRNLLAKEEGNQLLLRGPRSEILAARKFLAEEGENSQAEKNMKISSERYKYRNGIEVDASVFKLLEKILSKEIENINHKFDTLVEIKEGSYGQKVVIFRSKPKTSDMSSHATESFINAFQSACAMLRKKIISVKLSEDQKKILNTLRNAREFEDLNVKLWKNEDKLIISGLPDDLCAAEEYLKGILNIEDSTHTKNSTPLSSNLSSQETTGASKKSSVRQKNKLSSEGQTQAKAEENKEDECPICMDRITNKETLEKCKHAFCKVCIDKAMTYKRACPVCNSICGVLTGNQPDGTMSVKKYNSSLPGYPRCGTIQIEYSMKGGIQTKSHPNPGQQYMPALRTAYLPDNEEGREILQLLRRAFNQKLIFTVGQSRTTGKQNVITWNDIHHKTSIDGGPDHFGYPDPSYLQRVRSELKAKGIE